MRARHGAHSGEASRHYSRSSPCASSWRRNGSDGNDLVPPLFGVRVSGVRVSGVRVKGVRVATLTASETKGDNCARSGYDAPIFLLVIWPTSPEEVLLAALRALDEHDHARITA